MHVWSLIVVFFIFNHFTFAKQDTNLNILYLGDSQSAVYPYGQHIDAFLKRPVCKEGVFSQKPNRKVNFFAKSGTSPRHWTSKPGSKNREYLCAGSVTQRNQYSKRLRLVDEKDKPFCNAKSPLDSIIKQTKPDLVVATFSANSINYVKKEEEEANYPRARKEIRDFLARLPKDKPCVLITNPPVSYTHLTLPTIYSV